MKTRYVWIGLIAVVVVVVGIGYRWWHKAPEVVEEVQGVPLSVDELCSLYNTDEQAADRQLLNRAVQLKGRVHQVIQNMEGGLMIVLQASDSLSEVQCAFRDKNIRMKEQELVYVKGFCTGKTITGISLTDCILID